MTDDPREIGILRRWSDKLLIGDGCWKWTGAVDNKGYGRTWFRKRRFLSHRVSYILFRGEIPDGMCVLHRCDNPLCIRPSHLFLGTQADNMHDMKQKGRAQHVGGMGGRKLSDEDVEAIRARIASGESYHRISRDYPVHRNTVQKLGSGQTWRLA